MTDMVWIDPADKSALPAWLNPAQVTHVRVVAADPGGWTVEVGVAGGKALAFGSYDDYDIAWGQAVGLVRDLGGGDS